MEPNEFDIMSLAEKLTAFESRLNSAEYVMSENKAEILQAKESIIDLNRKSNIMTGNTVKSSNMSYAGADKDVKPSDFIVSLMILRPIPR